MLTEADLWQDGKPLRVRDLMHLTGLSRPTIMAELDRGRLVGFRILQRPGSPWLFERRVVVEWWAHVKLERAS